MVGGTVVNVLLGEGGLLRGLICDDVASVLLKLETLGDLCLVVLSLGGEPIATIDPIEVPPQSHGGDTRGLVGVDKRLGAEVGPAKLSTCQAAVDRVKMAARA